MENLEMAIDADDILTIRIDLKRTLGLTKNRRNARICSSEGNIQLWKDAQPHPRKIKLNLNCFRAFSEDEAEALNRGDDPFRRQD